MISFDRKSHVKILETLLIDNKQYDLISTALHVGDQHDGHYVSFVKRRNKWFLMNDEQMEAHELPGEGGFYLMVYNLKNNRINLNHHEKRVYSQNGEDGILLKLMELLYDDTGDKNYVELGVEDGMECNTRILREQFSWCGLQIDGSHENLAINLRKEFITKENVTALLEKYDVPNHINCLSIDIDFNDFYCLREILQKHTCDIVICEYNATHLPQEDKVVPYIPDMSWETYQTNYFGVSILTLNKLCRLHGYTLVCCDSMGVNAFFVRDELLGQRPGLILNCGDVENLYQKPKYGTGPNGGHQQDPENRKYMSFSQV
jgi:hypothetical protein